MPAYTYAPAAVLVETTGAFAIGATGVLRASASSSPVLIYDLNGSPISSILVGPKGAHQAFMADIAYGVLDFGSVLLPVVSSEQTSAAVSAVATANQALDLASSAGNVTGTGVIEIEVLTQAAFNALGTKVATTQYLIVG